MFFHRRTSETRKQALQDICDRARSTDHLLPQLFLCPEGTNTNRKALIQFKIGNVEIREITASSRSCITPSNQLIIFCLFPSQNIGAFAPGVPVQPVLIKYPGTERIDAITWTYNQNYGYMFSVWYLLANPINRVVVEFLPIYNPTEEEKQSPELYAKNVQKIMAEALDIPAMDISYGAQYKKYCNQYDTKYEVSAKLDPHKKTD